MDVLRNKRTHLKGTISRLENFVTQINDETSLYDIKARLEQLEKIYDQFQSLDIEMIAQGESTAERESQLEDFESRYFGIKNKFNEIIEATLKDSNPLNSTVHQDTMNKILNAQSAPFEKFSKFQNNQQQVPQCTSSSSSTTKPAFFMADVKHPKLNIPKFSGKYVDYKSFFNLFTSSIHNNNALSATQKFQYLKDLLKDEPANLIRHLQVTDENYKAALEKLRDKYDKPSLVVNSFIEKFVSIPKADGILSLRNLSNSADKVLRGLRAQGSDAEKRDPWLIYLLCKKLDRDSLHAWTDHSDKSNFPSLDSFITFINNRCDALECQPLSTSNKKLPTNKLVRAYTSTLKQGCLICAKNHHLSYCPAFNRVNVLDRIEIVKEKNLCFNCLRQNHVVKTCRSKHCCENCKNRHHSLIHIESKPAVNLSNMKNLAQ